MKWLEVLISDAECPTVLAMDPQPLLRKSEVCERLNVSPRSLDRLIARGDLVAIRINTRVTRVTPESVEEFLKRHAA